jgi:hypothetical protein
MHTEWDRSRLDESVRLLGAELDPSVTLERIYQVIGYRVDPFPPESETRINKYFNPSIVADLQAALVTSEGHWFGLIDAPMTGKTRTFHETGRQGTFVLFVPVEVPIQSVEKARMFFRVCISRLHKWAQVHQTSSIPDLTSLWMEELENSWPEFIREYQSHLNHSALMEYSAVVSLLEDIAKNRTAVRSNYSSAHRLCV